MKKAGALILLTIALGVLTQSCGSTHEVCPAYGGSKPIEKSQNEAL